MELLQRYVVTTMSYIVTCVAQVTTHQDHTSMQAVFRLSIMNLAEMTYITCMNSREHEITIQ